MPDLSICIVNWNVEGLLRECLRSIFENTKGITFEVIVTDNASSDGSVAMAKREFPQVKLIDNDTNAGYPVASNQAMRASNGRYVLIFNSDTEVVDNALKIMVDFLDAHPDCGALAPKLINTDGSVQRSVKTFPTIKNLLINALFLDALFPRSKLFGGHFMTWWDYGDTREVEQPMGSAIMMRRKTLDEVGLFDEKIYFWFDEVDLMYRVKKAGWKIFFTPSASIIHHLSKSFKQWSFSQALRSNLIYRKSRDYFFRKNYGPVAATMLIFVDLAQIVLVMGIIYSVFRLVWNLRQFLGT